MEKGFIISCDPGFHGALAIYDPVTHRIISLIDTPLLPAVSKKKPQIDVFALNSWIGIHAPSIQMAVVESVYSMPGNDVQSMLRYGYIAGVVHGVLASYNIEIKFLAPSVWKAILGLSSDKTKSTVLAGKLFPEDMPLFAKKRHHDRAEAILMAYLGGLLLKTRNPASGKSA